VSSDEEIAVCLCYTLQELEKKQKKKLWVHPLNQKRITHSNVIFSLLCELRADKSKFKNYTHVNIDTFDFILQQIQEEIRKQDNHFRKSISPEERLLVKVRNNIFLY